MTHDALRPAGEPVPDLGFFTDPAAPPVAVPVADGGQFGTPVGADAPFGSAARTADLTPAPVPRPVGARNLLLAGVVVVALLATIGVLAVRAWNSTSSGATAARTTVSTPAHIGTFARQSPTATTLSGLAADITGAARLRPVHLATYSGGAVTAEVLAARPVAPLDGAAQAKVAAGFSAGIERLTDLPPELAPVGAGLTGTFACSQIELGNSVPVACLATSSGAVVVLLVEGQDYGTATRTAAQLLAGVEHR